MDKDLMIYFDKEGVAKDYDDTYDITIHCESEEEQQKAIEQLRENACNLYSRDIVDVCDYSELFRPYGYCKTVFLDWQCRQRRFRKYH